MKTSISNVFKNYKKFKDRWNIEDVEQLVSIFKNISTANLECLRENFRHMNNLEIMGYGLNALDELTKTQILMSYILDKIDLKK